jgi:hypothetical protein
MDLHAQTSTTMDHGNLLGLTSSYTTADGKAHDMADVWFAKDTATTGGGDLPVKLDEVLTTPSADISLASTSTADTAQATTASGNASTVAQASTMGAADSTDVDTAAALALASASSTLFDETSKNLLI